MRSIISFLKTKKKYVIWVFIALLLAETTRWLYVVAVPRHPPLIEPNNKYYIEEKRKHEEFRAKYCQGMNDSECLALIQQILLENRASEY